MRPEAENMTKERGSLSDKYVSVRTHLMAGQRVISLNGTRWQKQDSVCKTAAGWIFAGREYFFPLILTDCVMWQMWHFTAINDSWLWQMRHIYMSRQFYSAAPHLECDVANITCLCTWIVSYRRILPIPISKTLVTSNFTQLNPPWKANSFSVGHEQSLVVWRIFWPEFITACHWFRSCARLIQFTYFHCTQFQYKLHSLQIQCTGSKQTVLSLISNSRRVLTVAFFLLGHSRTSVV
jgi:hypothetical protein